jgi:hypothetical protein
MRAGTAAFGYLRERRSHSSQQGSPKNVQKLIRVRNGSLGVGTVSGTFLNIVSPVWEKAVGDAGPRRYDRGPRKFADLEALNDAEVLTVSRQLWATILRALR